ncbi:hypothetical protein BDZ89DRAFT_1240050, partial [Hymenopellis radicata]
ISKRVKVFTLTDVAGYRSSSSCRLSHRGKVYNDSVFLADHPRGKEIILRYGGQPVDNVTNDKLEAFLIGKVGTDEPIYWVASEDYHPDNTDTAANFAKNEFIDLRRPSSGRSGKRTLGRKPFYLKQILWPSRRGCSVMVILRS